MIGIFRQPYPVQNEPKVKIFTSLGIGLFVFVFLSIFRPLGLNNLPFGHALSFLLGYGIITTLCLTINFLLVPKFFYNSFSEEKWTVGKEIVFILWIIFMIGIANSIYSVVNLSLFTVASLSYKTLLFFQFAALAVAALVVTILVLLKNLRLTKKNIQLALEISDNLNHKQRLSGKKDEMITIESENKIDNFTTNVINIIAISAAENYIEINYEENDVLKKKLIRSSLKIARDNLKSYTAFYRCHRKWIVNLDHIRNVTGNSQGYKLIMKHEELIIPVSRNLNKELTLRISR
jgi:DNA-binding LytR/AlgR family response regulator